MKQTRVIFVRHGETEWNITARLNSTTDLALSQKGREDLEKIRQALSGVSFNRVIASPLRRAIETAQILAPHQTIETDARLTEVDFGPFEGKTPQECSEGSLAEAFDLWRREVNPVIPEAAEDFSDAAKRAQDFLENLQPVEGSTLIVSHGVFLRVLFCASILGMSPNSYRRLRIDNGGISVVSWEGDLPRLAALNTKTL